MSEVEPRNNLAWRVTVLERQVERLEAGQPNVVAERVAALSVRLSEIRAEFAEDMASLRNEMRERDEAQSKERATDRKILIGFFVSLALLGVAAITTIVTSGVAG